MGFYELLYDKCQTSQIIPESLLALLPRGFQELGNHAILHLHPDLIPYASQIVAEIPKFLPKIRGIWLREGEIQGKYREPGTIRHLWGDSNSEVTIVEHGIRYQFDFTRIMFSKGNVTERGLLPSHMHPDEIVFDMFAGIGYFSLGIAKNSHPHQIYAMEWNPVAFEYLKQNIKLNHVQQYITPLFGDCKEIVKKLIDQGIYADKIIMGLLPAPKDAISAALSGIVHKGGVIIYEGIESKDSTTLYTEFQTIAHSCGFQVKLIERRIVKSFKPHEFHVVLELSISQLQ